MLRLKSLFAFLALLLVTVGVPDVASAADKVKFVLNWFPSGYIGFTHVGQKLGFFADEGIEVTIELARGSAEAISRVATGTNDMGSAQLGAVMSAAAKTPLPVRAVLPIYNKAPDAIVSKKASGINTMADLKGKTLATGTFAGSNTVWPAVARANGLDPDSVKLLKVDSNALGALLASGQTDAIIAWVTSVPLYSQLLPPNAGSLATIPWSDSGYQGYNWSIIASDKMIKERPDVVRRFVKAYIRTVQFFLSEPEKAGTELVSMAPDTKADINIAEIRAMAPLITNELSQRYGFGKFEKSMVDDTWKWVAAAENLPMDKIDPMKTVDPQFTQ